MSDVVIRAEGLGKKYLIGHQVQAEPYAALRDVIGRTAKGLLRTARDTLRGRQLVAGQEIEEFWALQDVSFEVKRGEVLGIIGRNGAGKSTLLKVLSRITEPSTGRVEIRGRIASLLEVGTGFHPELTGRENIYLNGAILGMSRAEISAKFDEIVAFAGVERFLDTPVKRYSSGMYVRLAFAVAAHLEPEILIIDEVLAVGDAEFQRKCLGKMQDVAGGGRTVLFVSHNMAAVNSLCSTGLLLGGGRVEAKGRIQECIDRYVSTGVVGETSKAFIGNGGPVSLLSAALDERDASAQLLTTEPIVVRLTLDARGVPASELIVGFTLHDWNGAGVLSTYFNDFGDFAEQCRFDGRHVFRCVIPANTLNEGTYRLAFDVGVAKSFRATSDDVHTMAFQVVNLDGAGSRFGMGRSWRKTPILPSFPWKVDA